jgi:hypothetical protein
VWRSDVEVSQLVRERSDLLASGVPLAISTNRRHHVPRQASSVLARRLSGRGCL